MVGGHHAEGLRALGVEIGDVRLGKDVHEGSIWSRLFLEGAFARRAD